MRNDTVYLLHILDAIGLIKDYTGSLSVEEFGDSRLVQDGVIRELSVIGEACHNLSEERRSRHPEVPWADIMAMRNILIHQYFGVDIGEVWRTVTADLPVLEQQVAAMLQECRSA
jgi:uncharacterized protein with HEPN domain